MWWLLLTGCVFDDGAYTTRAAALQDADGDGYLAEVDCDDRDPNAHPGGEERCDGVDNDCDGSADEDALDQRTFFPDADGDGFGPEEGALLACEAPDGAVLMGGDCDDNDATVRPGALEVCDGVDNDCDGVTDPGDAAGASAWYSDADGDGFGLDTAVVYACVAPPGSVPQGRDCDDDDDSVSPGAVERCNGVDDDCDGLVDPDTSIDAHPYYADGDGDGYGVGDAHLGCVTPAGAADQAGDCDDARAEVFPGADEQCDGVDGDCDGEIDEGLAQTWLLDLDGDGYGGESVSSCAEPERWAGRGGDCDDEAPQVHPGADEVCDGIDANCDGNTDQDLLLTFFADWDGDGWGAEPFRACALPPHSAPRGGDCDDTDNTVSPGSTQPDVPMDGIDQDCDGSDACEDFSCDGYPDWVLLNPMDRLETGEPVWYGVDTVTENDGGPVADAAVRPFITSAASGGAAGDLNGDGYLDLVVNQGHPDSPPTSGGTLVYFGDAAGLNLEDPTLLQSAGASDVDVVDLDHDGVLDVLIAQQRSYFAGAAVPVLVYWGPVEPSGVRRTADLQLSAYGTGQVEVVDLDGDGWEEVVACGQVADAGQQTRTAVHWHPGSSDVISEPDWLQVDYCMDVEAVDLNGDGVKELLLASSEWGTFPFGYVLDRSLALGELLAETDSVLFYAVGQGGGRWGYPAESALYFPRHGTQDLEVADMDHDGRLDLIMGGVDSRVDVYYGCDGPESWCVDGWQAPVEVDYTERTMDLLITDVDGDVYPDLIHCGYYDNSSRTLRGTAAGFAASTSHLMLVERCERIAPIDSDLDGRDEWILVSGADLPPRGTQLFDWEAGAFTSEWLGTDGYERVVVTSHPEEH